MIFPRPLLSSAVVSCIVHLVVGQTQYFYSIPSLTPPYLTIQTVNTSLIDENTYIFVAPYDLGQPSPLIYDNSGMLIWDGLDTVSPNIAQDLTVCDYGGSPHLCFVSAQEFLGYARGNGLILDTSYNKVSTLSSGLGQPLLDQHDFKVIENGTSALITIYSQVQYDASFYTPGVSWVSTGLFQELDTSTGNVNFEWNALDHVNVSQSYVLPSTTDISGNGLVQNTAWDYFHINSVDKTAEGDYIVSGRHVKTIFKISGLNGSIIWQLGGKQSNFTMNYEFNFQHDARIRSESGSILTISLYDNGSDDSPPLPGQTKAGYESYSSGMVIEIDQVAMTSTLLERYVSPGQQLSISQGNFQYLPNGNKFMGMGAIPYIVEFTDNSTGAGQVALYGNISTGISYRSFKFPWNAQPAAPPNIATYAHNCSTPTVFYASWNGATNVASWRFATSSNASGPFYTVGEVPKNGFETMATFPSNSSTPYAVVEALDAKGNQLSCSPSQMTFVPASSLAANCTDTSCGTTFFYGANASQTCPP